MSEFLGRCAAGRTRRVDGATICDRPLLRNDGATAWLEVTTRQLLDERGEPAARTHTLVDVTWRRGREIELSLALDRQRAQRALAEKAIDGDLDDLFELAASTLADQLEVELVSIAAYEDGEDSPVEPLALVGWPAVLARNEKRPPDAARGWSTARPFARRCAAATRWSSPTTAPSLSTSPIRCSLAAGVRSATVVGFAHGHRGDRRPLPRAGSLRRPRTWSWSSTSPGCSSGAGRRAESVGDRLADGLDRRQRHQAGRRRMRGPAPARGQRRAARGRRRPSRPRSAPRPGAARSARRISTRPAGGWLRQALASNSVVHLTEVGPEGCATSASRSTSGSAR